MTNPLRDKVETLDGDQWVVGIEPSTIRRTEPIHPTDTLVALYDCANGWWMASDRTYQCETSRNATMAADPTSSSIRNATSMSAQAAVRS
jgi:hypothetical protein